MAAPFLYLDGIPISVQEARVLVLNIYGLSYTEMADFLGCKPNTISSIVRQLHSKLEVHSNTEMLRFSLLNGFDIYGKFGELDVLNKTAVLDFVSGFRKLQ